MTEDKLWNPATVQAATSIFAAITALVIPFIMNGIRSRNERIRSEKEETVALQAVYSEIRQLQSFFLKVSLDLDQKDLDALKTISNGYSDIDPRLPPSAADGRFEVMTHLSMDYARAYTVALARRRSLLTSLSAVLNDPENHAYSASEYNNYFDFDKAADGMKLLQEISSQGVDACAFIVDEAEKRDPMLRPTGVTYS